MHLTSLITTFIFSNSILLSHAAPSHPLSARQVDAEPEPPIPSTEALNPFESDIELIFTPTPQPPAEPQPEAVFPTRPLPTSPFPSNITLPVRVPVQPLRSIQWQGTYLFGTPTLVTSDWAVQIFNNGTLYFYSHIHQLGSSSCFTSYVIACAEVDNDRYMYLQAHFGQERDICVNEHDIRESWFDISYELLTARERRGWAALTEAAVEMVCRVRLGDDAKVDEVVGRLRESMEGRHGDLTGETVSVD